MHHGIACLLVLGRWCAVDVQGALWGQPQLHGWNSDLRPGLGAGESWVREKKVGCFSVQVDFKRFFGVNFTEIFTF